MTIQCSNPRAQYLAHKSEIDSAVKNVFEGGHYILGRNVESFEKEFAGYIGTKYGIGVASGTEALHIALRACGVRPGDEVITSGHTAVATVVAIELAGAVPVLVDIEPDYYTMDPCKLKKAISRRTKVIIPVHIYGQCADLLPIIKIASHYGIKVIEDCAQATGAAYAKKRAGSWGLVSAFSFYPTKNLGAMGDGGMVVTSDSLIARKSRLLREYGWRKGKVSEMAGWNSRLDELQAAILRVKLKYLDSDNRSRLRLAGIYQDGLSGSGLALPSCRPGASHVYHLYVIRSRSRDNLIAHLRSNDIGALIHYPVPVHRQKAYSGRVRVSCGGLPETIRASGEILSLPIYPELRAGEINKVIRNIKSFMV